jgi:hypothetical protein
VRRALVTPEAQDRDVKRTTRIGSGMGPRLG